MAMDQNRWGYRTISAQYKIQVTGTFRLIPIWKTRAVHKCRFYAQSLLCQKILTANNLIKRGSLCKLFGMELEIPQYLCKGCTFTKETWIIVLNSCDTPKFGIQTNTGQFITTGGDAKHPLNSFDRSFFMELSSISGGISIEPVFLSVGSCQWFPFCFDVSFDPG